VPGSHGDVNCKFDLGSFRDTVRFRRTEIRSVAAESEWSSRLVRMDSLQSKYNLEQPEPSKILR